MFICSVLCFPFLTQMGKIKPDHWRNMRSIPRSYCKEKVQRERRRRKETKGKGKVVMRTYWGSGGIAPRILDLGIRWRWVVSFTPRPLYPQGKSPQYPLGRTLGGPQSRSGYAKGKEEEMLKRALLSNIAMSCAIIILPRRTYFKRKLVCNGKAVISRF
jgi:hypothetical protein